MGASKDLQSDKDIVFGAMQHCHFDQEMLQKYVDKEFFNESNVNFILDRVISTNGQIPAGLINYAVENHIYLMYAKIREFGPVMPTKPWLYIKNGDGSLNQLENEYAAVTCQITKIGNREAYKRCKISMQKKKNKFMLSMDLQNFKNINDMISHQAGDNALLKFAQKCKSIILSIQNCCANVFRTGGDEFMVLGHSTEYEVFLQLVKQIVTIVINETVEETGMKVSTYARIGGIYGVENWESAESESDHLEHDVKNNICSKRGRILLKPDVKDLVIIKVYKEHITCLVDCNGAIIDDNGKKSNKDKNISIDVHPDETLIQFLEEKIIELETKNNILKDENPGLKDENSTLKNNISGLKEQIQAFREPSEKYLSE